LTQELSEKGGFDAIVWRVKPDSEMAGANNVNAVKVYISNRSKQGGTAIPDDVELSV
jgi:hypothetical protein